MTLSELPSRDAELKGDKESFPWTGNGAFLFPGQGAQKKGMGAELFKNFPAARSVFLQANDLLGYDIADICFNNPGDALRFTQYAQPASAVVDIAAYRAAVSICPELAINPPVASGGVSFGELPNLVVAGSIGLADLFVMTGARGMIAEKAGNSHPGKMVSILRLERADVQEICSETGDVWAAIYYPGITVISGSLKGIEKAVATISEKTRGRVIDMGVEYAFHTPLMESALPEFARIIDDLEFKDPSHPVIMNPSIKTTRSGWEIKRMLPLGLTHPIDAVAMIAEAKSLGAKVFAEFCPQPVLTNHLKRQDKEAKALSVHDFDSAQQLAQILKF